VFSPVDSGGTFETSTEHVSSSPPRPGPAGVQDRLLSPRPFRRLIRKWAGIDRIEDATVPLLVVATDALNGEAGVLDTGPVVDALMASAAIPGLLPPVRIAAAG
jgi:NTE family protein